MTRLRPRWALLALLAVPGAALADDVLLSGGTRLQGIVLEQDDQSVVLLLPEGVELRLRTADVATVERDEKAPSGDQFVRYAEDAAGGRLQTAVVHLVGPRGSRVDLIGALHIADRAFFREVQALLERADAVLYEIVKPKDVALEDLATSPIRELQEKLAKTLSLVFQMDEIDYDRPHFVHADLAPDELGTSDSPAEKGQLPPQIQEMLPTLQLLGGFLDVLARTPEQQVELKRTVGRMMGTFGPRAAKLLGPQVSEMLIARRNAVVIERLQALPENARRVAVFYGAAHLPDLEKRLVEIGYRRAGARWMDGWLVPARKKPTNAAEPSVPR